MKLKRIMIAAPKSGSGKTMITCALLGALKNRGEQVVSFKCGPDYIDPMFHKEVMGIPSKNLDTFFTDEAVTRELFLKDRNEKDFAVMEGVMGLFDGLSGIREEGSSYHLAKVTKTPILLVVDAKGMGYSVIPVIAGFLEYDTENLIQGVILNRMSGAYYDRLKPLMEDKLKIRVLGYFPEQRNLHIESRHLGLVMPGELEDIHKKLRFVSEEIEKTVDIEEIRHIAEKSVDIDKDRHIAEKSVNIEKVRHVDEKSADIEKDRKIFKKTGNMSKTQEQKKRFKNNRTMIAVAKDEAFCFYYEDNLRLLREKGAEIEFFSPLHDRNLPKDCDALLIGGGYPELYAEDLSRNVSMRNTIKQAFKSGMPIVAECGGFMYLHNSITDKNGIRHKMVGVIPEDCIYKKKLVRFGYIEIRERKSFFLPEGETIKGHEFHYFDSTDNGEDCIAIKPVTGNEYPCVFAGENFWMGFPHLYYPSNPSFADNFVKKAVEYKNRKEAL